MRAKPTRSVRILALCCVYNRRDRTLRTVQELHRQLQALVGIDHRICVVDDGSTDETAGALRNALPDIQVVETGGDAYWAGAMRFGYRMAWCDGSYTHLLVFNDDIDLAGDAMRRLLGFACVSDADVIACAFKSAESGELTYGGMQSRCRLAKALLRRADESELEQGVDTLNMNLAIIRAECLRRVGFLSTAYTHSMADFDFGFRVVGAGGRIVQAPGNFGQCTRNPVTGTWLDWKVPFARRWKLLNSPKGLPIRERAVYLWRHGGLFMLPLLVLPYVKLLLPKPQK